MKKMIMGAALAVMMSTAAHAETVGVSMALFDDNFLTVLRNGMQDYAKTLDGVTLQVEDAQNDVAKQQSQIQNFIAAGVDATDRLDNAGQIRKLRENGYAGTFSFEPFSPDVHQSTDIQTAIRESMNFLAAKA